MDFQSRQIYELLLELGSLDLSFPLSLPHPFGLSNLLNLIHLLQVFILLIG